MKKIKVRITEMLDRVVEIEAEDNDNALEIANDYYLGEAIILDAGDFAGVTFEVIED